MSHRRTEEPRVTGEELDRAARMLPRFAPDSRRVAQVREAILDGDHTRRGPLVSRHIVRMAALATAACALLVLAWLLALPGMEDALEPSTAPGPQTTPRVAQSRAVLNSEPAALFQRIQPAPNEIVRVRNGTLRLEVSPLARNDRFRVAVGSAWIEVRGTRFSVTARADRLVRVEVEHGLVVVDIPGAASIWLATGESWDAGEPEQTENKEPQTGLPPPKAKIRRAPESRKRQPAQPPVAALGPATDLQKAPPRQAPAEAPEEPANPEKLPMQVAQNIADHPDGEVEFRRGWAEFKLGHYREAASDFENSCRSAGLAGPGEDACYWYAVATERAGDPGATQAYRRFLASYPRSARAGEASVALGWLLVSQERWTEATSLFEAAEIDPVPAVRQSARAGLRAVSRATEVRPQQDD